MNDSGEVLNDILSERRRQNEKWGVQRHEDGTGPNVEPLAIILAGLRGVESITSTDLASHAQMSTDICADLGSVTWADILLEEVFEALAEDDLEKLRTELVQVAAVAVQWAEAIDRREVDNEA